MLWYLQLRQSLGPQLDRPVVLIQGNEAGTMMEVVKTTSFNRARARIKVQGSESSRQVGTVAGQQGINSFTCRFYIICANNQEQTF